jgi:hypothetical protein
MWLALTMNESVMIMKKREKTPDIEDSNEEPVILPFTPMAELEHLLKVAGSVTGDANKAWAEIWEEFKRIVTSSGVILDEAKDGFVPSCGWPEFLEKFWLLKHYLDSVERICKKKH